MDIYCTTPNKILNILNAFFDECQIHPIKSESVTQEEVLADWNTKFPLDSDGEYTFTDVQMMEFINHWVEVMMDRTLAKMVKNGTVEMMHDGNDFCFRRPKGTL